MKSIARILQDPPTEEQIATIQMMQEELGTHYEYNCKAEAAYVEGLLKNNLNKIIRIVPSFRPT